MLLYFVLLLENVFHSQYIPYVSYFHIYVFLFCDDELYMLKSNKLLFCSVLLIYVTRQNSNTTVSLKRSLKWRSMSNVSQMTN